MNWSKPRDNLIISRYDTNISIDYNENSTRWRNLRKITLDRLKYICRYCGAYYQKYMIAISLANDDDHKFSLGNIEICCRACYLITHINYGFNDEMILCRSKLSQLDIVKKTIDYVILNRNIPDIKMIDSNAQKSPITLLELSYILSIHDFKNIPKSFRDLKIFFTPSFDITFIQNNYFNYISRINKQNEYLFIDDNEPSSDSSDVIVSKFNEYFNEYIDNFDNDLPDYTLSHDEHNFLENFFNK